MKSVIAIILGFSLVVAFLVICSNKAEAAPRVSFAQVKGNSGQDGEVLATKITTTRGEVSVVIGGNFDYLLLPNGRRVNAKNLAVVSLYNENKVLLAGNVNNHVRALAINGDRLFIGGDFTSVNGQSRRHTAAFARSNLSLLGWNPGSSRPVYGMGAAKGRIVYGGKSSVVSAANHAGQVIWTKPKTTGDVKVVIPHKNGNSFYVGGLFDRFDNRRQHGLVRVNARTGKLYKFNPRFKEDRPLNYYNGDSILSLDWDHRNDRLIVGSGGSADKGSKNAVWSLNPNTGSWRGSGWGRQYRRTSGDVQAVEAFDNRIVAGYHRNLSTFRKGHGRFTVELVASTGKPTGWNPGLWGNQRNQSGSNNGVSALAYYRDRLVIGGAFLGYDDKSKSIAGKPGKHAQGLLIFRR